MDNSKTVDCIEFCFGYGGNHLGLKRVVPNLRCLAASEIEAYACANLVAKMEAGLLDPFPIWTDVKTFPSQDFSGLVDIFIASYPCQPFSSAGKRGGADDPRHLWPFVRRSIEIIQPRFVLLENVEGHVSLGLREVLTELALLGYRVENSRGEPTWGIFSAAEIGAPHNRKRVFILAAREGVVLDNALREQVERFNARGFRSGALRAVELDDTASGSNEFNGGIGSKSKHTMPELSRLESSGMVNTTGKRARITTDELQPVSKVGKARKESGGGRGRDGEGLAFAISTGHQGCELSGAHGEGQAALGPASERRGAFYWPGFVSRPGEPQHEWEPRRVASLKRGLGGSVNGRAANVDRLRLLGNGVYPATAAIAFATLYARLTQ